MHQGAAWRGRVDPRASASKHALPLCAGRAPSPSPPPSGKPVGRESPTSNGEDISEEAAHSLLGS